MLTQQKRLTFILLAIPLLLSIPLVAMQFSHEVNWSAFDFIVMGGLLLGLGLGIEFVLRKVKETRQRLLIIGAIILGFLLLWAEMAVGLFNSPIAGS